MTTEAVLVADGLCAQAIDAAWAAVSQDVPAEQIGPHLEVIADADRVVTHLFECRDPAYVGWRWAATVARADGSDHVTIDEVVLLPGPDSVRSPAWLPWDERIEAGDLGVGDVLPTALDDPRLLPGYTGVDIDDSQDDDLIPVLWELGLGRVRVLSPLGRDEAASRWIAGETGPDSPLAKAATDQCSTCGFMVAMAGPLGHVFGLCANEYSPADGRVVALDSGCGAHSEAEAEPPPVDVVELVVDDLSPATLDLTEDAVESPTEGPATGDSANENPATENPATDDPTADVVA